MRFQNKEEAMRSIVFGVATSLALFTSAVLAQQPSTGETIGHPPPLAGPPSLHEPPATTPPAAPASSAPTAGEPKGYTGAYAPSNTPATPYSTGPLLTSSTGPGLNVQGPDYATRTVKAVPCSTSARETDGFTTCVGLPDQPDTGPKHRHRR
jgi:hypothetical protein